MADLNALARNPLVLAGAAVVVIGVAAGGYFLGTRNSNTTSTPKTAAEAASARGICEATLDRVRNFGITSPSAQLTSTKPVDTDTKDRVVCNAKDGDATFAMSVDVKCDDMGDNKCLKLFRVTDAKGATLFQHRDFLPPED